MLARIAAARDVDDWSCPVALDINTALTAASTTSVLSFKRTILPHLKDELSCITIMEVRESMP